MISEETIKEYGYPKKACTEIQTIKGIFLFVPVTKTAHDFQVELSCWEPYYSLDLWYKTIINNKTKTYYSLVQETYEELGWYEFEVLFTSLACTEEQLDLLLEEQNGLYYSYARNKDNKEGDFYHWYNIPLESFHSLLKLHNLDITKNYLIIRKC